MRVLGVDPGLTRCGLGVVDGGVGRPLRMVAVGVVRTPTGEAVPQRLLALQAELERWVERYEPDAIAVERVFARHDVSTIMGTAQASAIPMLAAAARGLPLAMHTPSEVKAAVTGNGRADKAQVTAMISRILRLADPPKPADAADALALAVCHVWRGSAQSRIDEAVAASGGPRSARAAQLARRQAAQRQEAERQVARQRAAIREAAQRQQAGASGQTGQAGRAGQAGRSGQAGGSAIAARGVEGLSGLPGTVRTSVRSVPGSRP